EHPCRAQPGYLREEIRPYAQGESHGSRSIFSADAPCRQCSKIIAAQCKRISQLCHRPGTGVAEECPCRLQAPKTRLTGALPDKISQVIESLIHRYAESAVGGEPSQRISRDGYPHLILVRMGFFQPFFNRCQQFLRLAGY